MVLSFIKHGRNIARDLEPGVPEVLVVPELGAAAHPINKQSDRTAEASSNDSQMSRPRVAEDSYDATSRLNFAFSDKSDACN